MIDTHSAVIFAVLFVHLIGVVILAASAAVLVTALFVVIFGVQAFKGMGTQVLLPRMQKQAGTRGRVRVPRRPIRP
ncbi:hypothetical protein [Paenarthrobacter nitroguajacolicus]|uniref:hypothetical protein n=1 Tax=Paenarthrobacter nitroguajacolicus TaxID=211146 RepID=UPI00248CCA25|nr:hypothetical protein [Paenarthrobacter nitroguajacolicus]MDI2034445.1 hypothetical protein [Paenarthrobacter nitroguajacolicus]